MPNYKIPEYLKKKKRAQVKMNTEIRKRESNKFPNCIGMFEDPECINATPEKPGKDCINCPYFDQNGVVKENGSEKKNKSSKSEECKTE